MTGLEQLGEFESEGVIIIPSVLAASKVALLRAELENAISQDEIDYPDVFDRGMVHNCMFRGEEMCALLDNPVMNEYLTRLLSPTFIVYAYQSSSLGPGKGNYGSRIHVDSPRFIPGYQTNVGLIFPLDDFTLENGATHYLPGSHKSPDLPDEAFFHKHAQRAVCRAGDLIIFSGRLAHAAGYNYTQKARHSLTINMCRSYMRQRFDFPKMVASENAQRFSDNTRKLLGWNVRMPRSLDEFYLPPEQRLYKPNQG